MIKSALPLAVGLTLGAGASQFPEYAQQYAQRVGGAAEEIQVIADDFRKDAQKNNLSIEQAIAEYAIADSAFLNDRGRSMQMALNRAEFLKKHHVALQTDAPFGQLWIFAQSRDPKIMQGTWRDFKPALPFTFEGLIHAALGLLAGFGLISLVSNAMRRSWRWIKAT